MKHMLYLLHVGNSRRLERLLRDTLYTNDVKTLRLGNDMRNKRIIFAVSVDEYGMDRTVCDFLRFLRKNGDCLLGSVAGVIVDGSSELYTKQVAQELVLAANMAGCTFPGKPLVEGTGSLYNQHIMAARLGLSWEKTYHYRIRELAELVRSFQAPHFEHPHILMLHASDNARSNTVWMGHEVVSRLPESCKVQEISLQNGTIHDCRGCSYEACLHFAQNDRCFYGGSISHDVLPAIAACDAMLMLCPNYNDAVSANIMALMNRLTNLLVRQDLSDKYLFGIVVSGYSGSDLVARQLLGAMCLNKTVLLPPHFCLMQTAHDAGSARKSAGIDARISAFASRMAAVLQA